MKGSILLPLVLSGKINWLKIGFTMNSLQAKSANWKFLNFVSQLLSSATDERLITKKN